jgi:hypothetical protein
MTVSATNGEQIRDSGMSEGRCNETPLHNNLFNVFTPAINAMKLTGLYFDRDPDPNDIIKIDNEAANKRAVNLLRASVQQLSVLYPYFTLAVLWLNVLRFITAFKPMEQFGTLLICKLLILTVFVLCSLMQTSYFIVSFNGKIKSALHKLHVSDDIKQVV